MRTVTRRSWISSGKMGRGDGWQVQGRIGLCKWAPYPDVWTRDVRLMTRSRSGTCRNIGTSRLRRYILFIRPTQSAELPGVLNTPPNW